LIATIPASSRTRYERDAKVNRPGPAGAAATLGFDAGVAFAASLVAV